MNSQKLKCGDVVINYEKSTKQLMEIYVVIESEVYLPISGAPIIKVMILGGKWWSDDQIGKISVVDNSSLQYWINHFEFEVIRQCEKVLQ